MNTQSVVHDLKRGSATQALKSLRRKLECVSSTSNEAELNSDLAAMREAGKDAMFLADLEEAIEDFHHADIDGAPA